MLKDITLGQYFPGETVVHRLDPRAKILIALTYIVVTFCVQNFWDISRLPRLSHWRLAYRGYRRCSWLRGSGR